MNYIIEREQYNGIVATWKNLKSHTAEDHIIYNALRGFDIKRGFTPITNKNKLVNGLAEWSGFKTALNNAKHLLRGPSTFVYKFSTEEQTLKRTEEENNRMKQLNDKFGIEFTPELREKLKEIL